MDREMKHLKFVLRFYRPGIFDTRRALAKYKSAHKQERPSGFTLLRLRYAAAAAVVLCVVAAYFLMRGEQSTVELYADSRTSVYTLPDQSVVTLYPKSTLTYDKDDFGSNNRHVEMKGTVGFKVTRNPEAPFTVSTAYASVRVLGTEFTVDEQQTPPQTEVSVTSGKVLFAALNQADGVILTKGMQARLAEGGQRPEITADLSARQLIVFDRTPLAEVLTLLSERFDVQLTSTATDKTLTAEFDSDDIDEIIMLIEKSLDIKITKEKK